MPDLIFSEKKKINKMPSAAVLIRTLMLNDLISGKLHCPTTALITSGSQIDLFKFQ